VKKLGCFVVLAIPVVVWLATVYSGASRFEAATKQAEKTIAEEERFSKEAARQNAESWAERGKWMEREEIISLLRREDSRLSQKAAGQGSGGDVTCRSVNQLPTLQEETRAFWTVDFECHWPGGGLPDKRTVSVRLAKKNGRWMLD
jgi:hypothetical protein